MSKDLLITNSLLSGVDWLMSCPSSWKEKAYNDLKRTLSRADWTEPTPEIKRGIQFENKVCDIAQGFQRTVADEAEQTRINYFVDKIKGGKFQAVGKKIVTIDGESFCIYGKADVYFPGKKIIDIKTTGSYKTNKYTSTFQHIMYCYLFDETVFDYLVQSYSKETGEALQPCAEYWNISMLKHGCTLEQTVFEKVQNVRAFLRDYPELNTFFETVYSK